MNWSAELVVLVPAVVVTVTSTGPSAPPGGDVAVSDVPPPFTTTPVAGLAPKSTAVAPARFVPVTVTDVPPDSGPTLGLTEVTVGASR